MSKFKFTSETIGLPDHHILDDEGKLSLLVFRQQLGLDGKKAKAAKTKLAKFASNKPGTSLSNEQYPLIDWYSYPRWRQLLITIDLPRYLQEIKKSPKQDVKQVFQKIIHPSWDLIVMDAIAREHFLNSDLIDRADEPSLSKRLTDDKEWHPDLQHVLDLVRDSFEEKASGWSDLKGKERRQIAEIGLALGSVLDEEIFNRCLDSYEGFDAYFKTMLGFQYNWLQSVVGDLDEEEIGGASLSVEPVSERELYERIIKEATAGQENPGRIEHIERIQSHAVSLLDLIREHQSNVRLNDAFFAWCNSLFQRGTELALPLFADDEGVLTQFHGEWHRFFSSSEGQNLTARLLKDLYETAIDSATSAARLEEAIEKGKSDLALELEAVSAKAVSSPLERRSRAKRIVELGSEIQEKENAILEVQDEATVALLPPGGTIDALLESDSLEGSSLDEMAFPETVTDALLEFYSNSLKPALEQSAESGSVLETDDAVTARNNEIDDEEIAQIADSDPADHVDDSVVGLAEIEERDESGAVASESVSPDSEGADIEPREPDEWGPAETVEASNESDLRQGDDQATPNQTHGVEDVTGIVETGDKEGQSKTDIDEDSEEFEPENVVERFQYELEKGALSTNTVNAITSQMVLNGQLPMAHCFVAQIEQLDVLGDCLSSLLLKSAYYGSNTWDYGYSLTKSQRLLASLTPEMIDALSNQPGGEIVPYLVLVAVFQPALFGGNFTRAPYALSSLTPWFDKQTRQLIEATAEIAGRNEFVTVAQLGSQGDDPVELKFDPEEELEPWIQKILSSHRGYAPVLKAQKKCLEEGEFRPIVGILKSNDRTQTSTIEFFVAEMQNQESSERLLERSLRLAGQSLPLVEIFLRERRGFHAKVMDLVEIAKDWLAINKPKASSDIEKYCQRFLTQLDNSIKEFEARSTDPKKSESHWAGSKFVAETFKRLMAVVQGSEDLAWNYRQAKVWFILPMFMNRFRDSQKGPIPRINWLLNELINPTDMRVLFNSALEDDAIAFAEVARRKLAEQGKAENADKQRVAQAFIALKHRLIQKSKQLQSQVENASLSSLIGDSPAEKLDAELDLIQAELEDLSILGDIREIQDRLDSVESDISSKTASKKAKLNDDYQRQLVKLRTSVPDDPVPEQWIADIEQAFNNDNLPVVTEMLDELNTAIRLGRRIQFSRIQEVTVLQDFLAVEDKIYQGIARCVDVKKDLWHRVVDNDGYYGIDFSRKPPLLKKVVDTIAEFSTISRPPKSIDKELYEKVIHIMQFLGFSVKNDLYKGYVKDRCDYTITQGAAALNVELEKTGSQKPFPLFGEASQPVVMVLIAYQEWTPEQVETLSSSPAFSHSVPLLISAQPIRREKRNQLSIYFKQMQKTVLHLDTAMALFLGQFDNKEAENAAIRNFLWLTVPFTYYNPYVGGDTRYPPPREMRYGREREIESLLQMNNGDAIVFGGRQLGKSTILQEVHSRFHNPDRRQFAFYHHLDDMDRMDLSEADWQRAEMKVWSYIYDDLHRAELIPHARKGNTPPIEIQAEVKRAMREKPNAKVIIIFDEIDPVLNVDNAHDFKLVRALRGPVNDPDIQGRFKIVIGGLESVKRFENSPNYPLPQLGGSIQVTIMPTQDAIQLIREPFAALGYTFESAQVLNRILAITNRHPGLIQIFCHQLVRSLAANQRSQVGQRIITDDDVSAVYHLQDVLDLIRSRFEMTLNLDLRYLVIIYGLINESKASKPFSPREAKEIAEAWLPEEFTKLSDKQFEAFLTELVGLGVLRVEKEGLSNRYALRNTNVLKLLGSDGGQEVERNLQRALQEFLSSDPLDRHACLSHNDNFIFSPITYRDEKEILGTIVKEQADAELGRSDAQHYSVSIIVGSNALGADTLLDVLPHVYEADSPQLGNALEAGKYKLIAKDDTLFRTPEGFSESLRILLDDRAGNQPIMLFVTITGNLPLAGTLAMLDAAHKFTDYSFAKKYPFRVVFYMTPGAYFNWLQAPELTKEREGLQPFIKLGKWGKAALRYALEKLGMQSATDEVEELEEYSEGWYISLDTLAKIKAKKAHATELRALRSYIPMAQIKLSEAKRFLTSAGVYEFEWLAPLLRAISRSGIDDATVEDLYLIAEEQGLVVDGVSVENMEQTAIWMADMNLLRRFRKPDSHENYFNIVPSIKHATELVDGAT